MRSLAAAARRGRRALRPQRLPGRAFSQRQLPDYNTDVNVADIRLPKPARRAPAEGSWEGLKNLRARLAAEGSLKEATLRDMATDAEFQETAKRLKRDGQKKMTREEKQRRRRALDQLGVPEFSAFLAEHARADDRRKPTEVLQLNVGLYCNQACAHCHVESSPKRRETMSRAVADRCLDILRASPSVHTLDITGGAPEFAPEFRRIVERARALRPDVDIIDRCNLTVLAEPDQEDLADFLAAHGVRVAASLPCYSAKNVNLQRGRGVFARSIEGLRRLNEVGYGAEGTGLKLDLVYNPLGAFLPPPQEALRAKYKEELREHFGVVFSDLFTMTNMPIKRFADFLSRRGELADYLELLVRNFNAATAPSLMCRNTLSVNYDGAVYDCDFNQQLDLPLPADAGSTTVFDFGSTAELEARRITFDNHCFGCTAGMGSS
mmetsp:Transcript_12419/g.36925  ORF Transcript_12419/g.36925 Transcript_12419/m.36925 type:complete len:436 (+) Transcript_12419:183-1490(+)